jgi:hypothetical protein
MSQNSNQLIESQYNFGKLIQTRLIRISLGRIIQKLNESVSNVHRYEVMVTTSMPEIPFITRPFRTRAVMRYTPFRNRFNPENTQDTLLPASNGYTY